MSLITTDSLPPIPPSDTLYSKAAGVYYTYGPRVEIVEAGAETGIDHKSVVAPAEGQEPQFYGIYKHVPEAGQWQWVADVDTKAEVDEFFEKL